MTHGCELKQLSFGGQAVTRTNLPYNDVATDATTGWDVHLTEGALVHACKLSLVKGARQRVLPQHAQLLAVVLQVTDRIWPPTSFQASA